MATERSVTSSFGGGVALVRLVYIGFPGLWMAPIDRLHAGNAPDYLTVFALPIWFLMDHVTV